MSYTTITIHAEQLAAKLAQRKVEKKWEALGWSPYIDNIEQYVGCKYTEEAEKDYKKHYEYFLEIIISKGVHKEIDKEDSTIEI